MQINSLQSVGAVTHLPRSSNAKASEPVSATAPVQSAVDQLDLSTEAQQLLTSGDVSPVSADDIRMDRVSSIRQAIAEGTYETPEKLDVALDRLLDTLV